jgi:putative salt-induced outer membrane protein YdiY
VKPILLALTVLCLATGLLAQVPTPPQAPPPDRVTLKNGDQISGTLKSFKEGTVTFESPTLGKLSIKLADIKDITTTHPVAILTKADETMTRPIAGVQDLANAKAINIEKKPPVVWSGTLALGANWQAGNTDKRGVSSQVDFERRTKEGRLSGTGSVLYTEEKINRNWTLTDRVYRGRVQNDWFLSKQSYLLVFVGAERDALANLDLRLAVGPGYGYQWVDSEEVKYSTEIGPSYVREKYNSPTTTDDYLSGRLRSNLAWKISEDYTFLQDSSYFQSFDDKDDINAIADTRLRVSLTKEMFAQLQWIFEYDNTPAKGADRVDHTVLLSVGVTF